MRKLLSLSIILVLLASWGCSEDEGATTVVNTEEVIFVSGDKVRVLGRLITNQPISATDHGFYLSTSENFASPVIISLGPKDGPGRFIGETTGLEINKPYFAKAFVTLDGTTLFGEVVSLNTLNPIIETYSPTFSVPGGELVINGRNFPEDTRVFFGTQEATIISNLFESRLIVRIPAPSSQAVVPIRIQIQNQVFEFPQKFEYRSGKFTLAGQFPDGLRIYENAFFQNQEGLFAGLGSIRLAGPYSGFQRFNPQTGTWTAVSFPGSSVESAFVTSNYLGGGRVQFGINVFENSFEFWKINGSSFQRLPNIPFTSFQSIAFELNGQLFVAGGVGFGARGINRFNPQNGTWTTLNPAPIDLDNSIPSFTYQNKAYFVGADKNLWEYDPLADSWKTLTVYPGSQGNGSGMAVVLGDKAYIGLYQRSEELWELDLKTLTWKAKNPIPGFPQSINAGYYTFNGQIFFLRAPEESVFGNLSMELYRFEPDGI